jgi:hypothetical protein
MNKALFPVEVRQLNFPCSLDWQLEVMVSFHICRWNPALANGVQLAHFGSSPGLARLLVVLSLTQFLLQACSFQKFLETS